MDVVQAGKLMVDIICFITTYFTIVWRSPQYIAVIVNFVSIQVCRQEGNSVAVGKFNIPDFVIVISYTR